MERTRPFSHFSRKNANPNAWKHPAFKTQQNKASEKESAVLLFLEIRSRSEILCVQGMFIEKWDKLNAARDPDMHFDQFIFYFILPVFFPPASTGFLPSSTQARNTPLLWRVLGITMVQTPENRWVQGSPGVNVATSNAFTLVRDQKSFSNTARRFL